jgi:hypothetical protein
MRTIFTIEDIKDIVEQIFNGNLKEYKLSKGSIPYENPNSEKVLLIDEDDGTSQEVDIAEYLNVKFYNWKERLVSKENDGVDSNPSLSVFETWVQSLNFSMNEAYALVEKIDEEVTASQDIDSSTIIGKVTFLIQTDKIKNLDYYVTKIRNNFLGVPQDIQNSYGEKIKSFIMLGALSYDQEPFTSQLGECVVVSLNFRLSYLADALTYSDTEILISLDGDDEYDENGNLQGTTKYLTMPITKASFQNIFGTNAVPTSSRPDLTGFIANSISNAKTLTFFDFNKDLTMRFNDLFWRCSAIRVDGVLKAVEDVNIPVYIKVKSNNHFYIYKDVIENMQKSLTNNDFNISSISLKGWGKPDQ